MIESDVVELLDSWPQPGGGGEARVEAGPGPLIVSYMTAAGDIAVVQFPLCHQVIYGHPNDEALDGHPLYKRGLKFYSVHRIANSSRLAALERANSVHPRHDAAAYLKEKEHFVFTFQDATLECLVTTGERFAPKVQSFPSAAQASAALGRNVV